MNKSLPGIKVFREAIKNMAESEASKAVSKIDVEINTAQHQWGTYADILGAGYNDAYLHHKGALDEIFRAGDRPERVLNIPLLRLLGSSLNTPFLSRVDAIIANPKNFV